MYSQSGCLEGHNVLEELSTNNFDSENYRDLKRDIYTEKLAEDGTCN